MATAVDALAARCRVITFSLADEPRAGWPARGRGFDAYVEQIAQAMDSAGLERAVVCGVSYGGLIAASFLRRHPARVSGLALVSALPPSWVPDSRVKFFLRAPRLLLPLFLLSSLRLYREIAVASDGVFAALGASCRHAWRALAHFPDPLRMAGRVGLTGQAQVDGLTAIHVPTLIVTGEAHLDRVVPTTLTAEYSQLWPHATAVTLARTGHLGLITRPEAFADMLVPFVESCERNRDLQGRPEGLQLRDARLRDGRRVG